MLTAQASAQTDAILARTAPLPTRDGGLARTIAFSADGKFVVCAGEGQATEGWIVETGERCPPMTVVPLSSVAFVVPGPALADEPTQHRFVRLRYPGANGPQVAFAVRYGQIAASADGTRIASTNDERTVLLWDLTSGQLLRALEGHQAYTSAAAFSPDGRTVASGSHDRTVRIWDPETGKELHRCPGHTDGVASLAFHPDGKTLASASLDGDIRLWDAGSGKSVAVLQGHQIDVAAVAFAPDRKTLMSAGGDGTVRLWDLATRREQSRITLPAPVLAASLSPDGKTIATADHRNAVLLWDAATGKFVSFMTDPCSPRRTSCTRSRARRRDVAPDGLSFATGGSDGAVRLWDATTGKEIRILGRHPDVIWGIAFAPDGRSVASCARRHGVVRRWDVATGRLIHGYPGPLGGTTRVLFSRDGKRLYAAGGSFDPTLFAWDVDTGREEARFTGHSNIVSALSLSPDGRRLVSSAADSVLLWDTTNGRVLCRVAGTARIHGVHFQSTGRDLIAVGAGSCRHWDAATLTPDRTFASGLAIDAPVALAPLGRTLAISDPKGSIRLLDVTTGAERMALEPANGAATDDSGAVQALAFTSDGRRLIALGLSRVRRDSTAIVFNVTGIGKNDRDVSRSPAEMEDLWR